MPLDGEGFNWGMHRLVTKDPSYIENTWRLNDIFLSNEYDSSCHNMLMCWWLPRDDDGGGDGGGGDDCGGGDDDDDDDSGDVGGIGFAGECTLRQRWWIFNVKALLGI